MKRALLVTIVCFSALFVFSQQIDRDKVVVEIATGTWCTYCPGAALGADDLVANGHDVAIIENHNGDPFANNYSNARNTYYAVTGYPTAKFDGILTVVGGNHTQSMYPQYLPKYNQRIAIPSSFSIMIFGENNGLNYDVTLVAQKVASTTSQNMVIHLALTESEIQYNWQGQTDLNFVNRLMAPDQNGTVITFATGDTEIIELSFALNASWKAEHCELVAFIQDIGNKEILQGTKVALEDLQPGQMNNAAANALHHVPNTNCSGFMEPVVAIANMGIENLTSLDIHYLVNNGAGQTYNWTGDLAYMQTEEVTLSEITFDILADNLLTVFTANPNGNPDEDPTNDTITFQFAEAGSTIDLLYLMIKLDNMPEETTWEVKNGLGETLHSGGPYPNQPLAFIKDTLVFDANDCLTFFIYDAGGNGLCCNNGEGFYRITDESNNLLYTGNEFGDMDIVQFVNDHLIGINDHPGANSVSVFPNPFHKQTHINVVLEK